DSKQEGEIMRFFRTTAMVALGMAACALFSPGPVSGQKGPGPGPVTEVPGSSGPPLLAVSPGGMGGPATFTRDPEMEKLGASEMEAAREVTKLVAAYGKEEKEDEKAKIKTKLSEALSKQFDAQQKRRELELTRAEAQLKKVRELMKKRGEERKTIVE